MASDYQAREALLLQLLALPGATAPTVLDDCRWAWDSSSNERLFIDRLQLIQSRGVYPDRDSRLVRFNAALLVRAFPHLRERFAEIQALPPMRFEGKLPGRPQPKLTLVQASP